MEDGDPGLGIDTSGMVESAYFEKFDQNVISVDFLTDQTQSVTDGCEADPDSAVEDHLIPPAGG